MKHGKMYLVIIMMIQIQFLMTFYDETNIIFNNFLNTFLRNVYAIFPKKKKKNDAKFQCLDKNWDKKVM